MGGSASRSTVTPYRNVQYSVLSTGADLGSIKGMLPTFENKLDNLETENQAQAQKAITELKLLLNTSQNIPEDTLARIERLVFDFSHFVNNHGEDRLQQGKTKSRIKHGVGKTVIAGIVGLALGVIYSSFGDQDFNENESQGVAVITGTVSASVIAINELFSQYAIHNSESRQLVLAEEKAIHDFETGILDVKRELQNHTQEEIQQAFEQEYNKLLLKLDSANDFLSILTKIDKTGKSELMSYEFKEARQSLENRKGDLSDNLRAIERILEIYARPDIFRQKFPWSIANSEALTQTLQLLGKAAKSSLQIIESFSELNIDNIANNSALYSSSPRPQMR